jgi:hypothetical protein
MRPGEFLLLVRLTELVLSDSAPFAADDVSQEHLGAAHSRDFIHQRRWRTRRRRFRTDSAFLQTSDQPLQNSNNADVAHPIRAVPPLPRSAHETVPILKVEAHLVDEMIRNHAADRRRMLMVKKPRLKKYSVRRRNPCFTPRTFLHRFMPPLGCERRNCYSIVALESSRYTCVEPKEL